MTQFEDAGIVEVYKRLAREWHAKDEAYSISAALNPDLTLDPRRVRDIKAGIAYLKGMLPPTDSFGKAAETSWGSPPSSFGTVPEEGE